MRALCTVLAAVGGCAIALAVALAPPRAAVRGGWVLLGPFPMYAAVLLAIGVTLLLQPVRGRLEQLADRWVFGARLDGYRLLSRFGAALEKAQGPATLLQELAETVRRG
nr:hypothetical protein GCM10020093_111210 [Planobispora longispora]